MEVDMNGFRRNMMGELRKALLAVKSFSEPGSWESYHPEEMHSALVSLLASVRMFCAMHDDGNPLCIDVMGERWVMTFKEFDEVFGTSFADEFGFDPTEAEEPTS